MQPNSCRALDRLAGMVAVVMQHQALPIPHVAAAQRWEHWQQLAAALGLQEQRCLAVLLGPHAKAVLMHMEAAGLVEVQNIALQAREGSFWQQSC